MWAKTNLRHAQQKKTKMTATRHICQYVECTVCHKSPNNTSAIEILEYTVYSRVDV